MYRGVLVCLSVVVPTPRFVYVLCALSAVSLRLCAAYPVFLDWPWSVCYVARAAVLVGRTYWAIVGCCCDELYYISPYVTKYTLLFHCRYVLNHLLL